MKVYKFVNPNNDRAQELISELSEILKEITGDNGKSSFSEEDFNDKTDAFLIIEINGNPIACGGLRKIDNDTCEIKRMYSRIKGYGREILNSLEIKANEIKYRNIILSTRRVNTGAVEFYLKNGYKEIAPYGKYRNTNKSICMSKIL